MCGESLICGNWFFHMTGLYTVALSAVYGVSVFCLSEYSDSAFLEAIIDNKPYTAALYPWQVLTRHCIEWNRLLHIDGTRPLQNKVKPFPLCCRSACCRSRPLSCPPISAACESSSPAAASSRPPSGL